MWCHCGQRPFNPQTGFCHACGIDSSKIKELPTPKRCRRHIQMTPEALATGCLSFVLGLGMLIGWIARILWQS